MDPFLLVAGAFAIVAGSVLILTTVYVSVLFALGAGAPSSQLPRSETEREVYVLIASLHRSPALEETLRRVQNFVYPKLKLLVALAMDEADLTESQAELKPPIDIFEVGSGGGKAQALNRGFWHALSYFLLLDEDSRPDDDCLIKMVPYLEQDEKVWAVVGLPYPSNPGSGTLQRTLWLEADTWATVARAKDRLGLFLPATGFLALIRWESLNRAPGSPAWNERALAEDTELSVRQYIKGWKTRLSTARVGIEAPPTLRALFGQRLRWYDGMLEALAWNFRGIWRLPFHRGVDVVLTLLAPMGPAAFVVLLLLSPLWPGLVLPVLLALLALQLVAARLSSSGLSERRTSVVLFSVLYMLIQGVAALTALGAFVLGIKVRWQRTPKVGDRTTAS